MPWMRDVAASSGVDLFFDLEKRPFPGLKKGREKPDDLREGAAAEDRRDWTYPRSAGLRSAMGTVYRARSAWLSMITLSPSVAI